MLRCDLPVGGQTDPSPSAGGAFSPERLGDHNEATPPPYDPLWVGQPRLGLILMS